MGGGGTGSRNEQMGHIFPPLISVVRVTIVSYRLQSQRQVSAREFMQE
jgi:hypothetical protein